MDCRLIELAPDDALVPAWCEVWAAGQRADRPGEPPRSVTHHVVPRPPGAPS